MKIALCFSGQPRFVKETYSLIKENVIRDNDVDVFGHLWFDQNLINEPYKHGGDGNWINQRIDSNSLDYFQTLYNPKKLLIEKSKKFINSNLLFDPSLKNYWKGAINNPKEPNFKNRTINNTLSYFYSLNEVCKLKKLYEFENDLTYDVVIKCRTDSEVRTAIIYKNYNLNIINYTGILNQSDGMIADWFNFGSSKIMDAFMSVFSVSSLIFDKCIDETEGKWCPELMHKKMIDCFGIGSQPHNIHITLPRF